MYDVLSVPLYESRPFSWLSAQESKMDHCSGGIVHGEGAAEELADETSPTSEHCREELTNFQVNIVFIFSKIWNKEKSPFDS
jgi:hypothetical protein